ncbi:MAG TPA: hypothetical protein VJ789_05090 [Burkholderiales bacterium]|nr:hypothetical protein [Burkholderiales bacterium]
MVDLHAEGAQVAQLWNGSEASHVPLSVAAAFTFHHTRHNDAVALSTDEYAVALDIAAAALACLVPVYAPDRRGELIPVRIDFAQQRFGGGATEVRCADGSVVAPLAVVRSDVLPALMKIERSGIEYLAPRGAQGPVSWTGGSRR